MRLLAFLCCDKVIIDQQGNPSLIMLLETLTVHVPAEAEIPADVVSPREWWIFTMWTPEPQDIGKTFQQHIELISPNGKITTHTPLAFTTKNDEQARNIQQVLGFPVGTEGHCFVKMWIQSDDKRVTETFSYRLTVKHQKEPKPVTA